MSTIKTISLKDIKTRGTNALPKGGPTYLIVNSKMHSVIVPFGEYEAMVELLEDMEDIRAIEERKNEGWVTWDEVFPKKRK